ncbi:MAG: extracellular solute-binding protein [Candidatus Kerfeldbacteria bacterium]|nr:extracellular solute-binding protein [Candidatus Kerfeldbacteria bacterium]
MNRRTVLWFVVLLVITTSGAICRNSGKVPATVTLQYWTVYTEEENILPSITAFQANHPYIKVEVRQLTPEEYENSLIEAWAQGEGPDIFSIPNSHLGKFKNLISPLPSSIKVATVTTEKSFGSTQQIVDSTAKRTISPQQISSLFPQVVSDDTVLVDETDTTTATEKVFGLPLSLDTLVLYYNKDLLSKGKIPLPATTWQEFVEQVPKMTLVDIDNNVIQAGAALGTANNVPGYFDIMSLLMMQNGAVMSLGDRILFADESEEQRDYFPGSKALEFYTSFANPEVEWYSWNSNQPDALETFINGTSAYFLGYHYQLADIKNRAPQLNFDIAPIPQVDLAAEVNYANYWLETVSINSAHPNEAWALVEYITTTTAVAQAYADATGQPAALKAILADQQEDFTLSVFANQALTAQSWYAGSKPAEVDQAFADMITVVNDQRLDPQTAVANTAAKVELTYE